MATNLVFLLQLSMMKSTFFLLSSPHSLSAYLLFLMPDILFMPLHHRKEKLFAGKIGESYIKFLLRLIFHFLPYQCRGYGGNKEVTCFETALKVSSFLCKFQNYLFLPF